MPSTEVFDLLLLQTAQVSVLAIFVWLVVHCWAKDRPHLAHALWGLVLLKCVAPPVLASPTSPFSWLSPATIAANESDPTPDPSQKWKRGESQAAIALTDFKEAAAPKEIVSGFPTRDERLNSRAFWPIGNDRLFGEFSRHFKTGEADALATGQTWFPSTRLIQCWALGLSLIHISEPTRHICLSRMPSSA
mgnify:CR=1 FL=1